MQPGLDSSFVFRPNRGIGELGVYVLLYGILHQAIHGGASVQHVPEYLKIAFLMREQAQRHRNGHRTARTATSWLLMTLHVMRPMCTGKVRIIIK
jgi:hypothetical protein